MVSDRLAGYSAMSDKVSHYYYIDGRSTYCKLEINTVSNGFIAIIGKRGDDVKIVAILDTQRRTYYDT